MRNDITFQNKYVSVLTLRDALKNGNGTKLKKNNEQISIPVAISNEIAAFQQRIGNLQLLQRALIIDWDSQKPSKYVLGEAFHAIQTIAQNWKITVVTNNSNENTYSLLDQFPKKVVLKAAIKHKLLKLPFVLKITDIVISMVLMTIFSFIILAAEPTNSFTLLSTLAIPVIVGSIASQVRKYLSLRDFKINIIKKILIQNKGTHKYDLFIAELTRYLSREMPLAVIVEDLNKLDEFSIDLIKYVVFTEDVPIIGAIFWVLFSSSQQDKTITELLKHSALNIKEYSIVSPINLPDGI